MHGYQSDSYIYTIDGGFKSCECLTFMEKITFPGCLTSWGARGADVFRFLDFFFKNRKLFFLFFLFF